MMMDGVRSGSVGGYANPPQPGKEAGLGLQPSQMKIGPYPVQYAHTLLKPGTSLSYVPRLEASPYKGRLNVGNARPLTPPGPSHTSHPSVLGGPQMVYSAPSSGRSEYGLVPPSATYELNVARGFRSPPGLNNTHHEKKRLTLLPSSGDFGPHLLHGHGQIFPHQLGPEIYRENMGAYHHPSLGLSLLPTSADQHLDHGPYKRMRLSGENKLDLSQPLKIDTRAKEPMYTPQVEAISPTPGDRDNDDSPSRSTKDELLQQISKVDREIGKAESSVSKLKRKKQELEESSSKSGNEDKDIEVPKSRHRSLAQIIYSENRKKASEAHGSLTKLGPVVEFPLYNQPQDMPVFHENQTKYTSFRPRLVEFLKRQRKDVEETQSKNVSNYSDRLGIWMKRVDRIERGVSPPPYDPNPPVITGGITFAIPVLPKKRERDQRNRENFEKVFPELRKQREDKERLSRAGSRVKSDADLEEIMDGLQEQENEDKKMRSLAVVPPLMMDKRQRRLYYDNRNGVVEDSMDEHRERQLLNVWTEQEKDIFKEKYLQHPKSFVVIASFLERKCVAECVHYYYLSKKTENYKQMLRKSRARTRARTVQKSQQQQQDMTVGVTTRLQREALMKQGETSVASGQGEVMSEVKSESEVNEGKSEVVEEKLSLKDGVKGIEEVRQEPATVEEMIANSNVATEVDVAPVVPEPVVVPTEQVSELTVQIKEETPLPRVEEEEAKPVLAMSNKESSVTCVVCLTTVPLSSSRSLLTKDASMFGMKEGEVIEGSRVCVTCRCNGVRRRLVNCPIPTCPTPKRRVKRLRPLPSKWLEMSLDSKSQIISELQIPQDITRCCAACVNRISRRVGLFDSGSDASEPSRRDSEIDESEGSSTSSNEEDVPDDRLQINETPETTSESPTKAAEPPRIEISEVKLEPIVKIEPALAPPPLKDDYDSAETVSADEGQGQLDTDEGPSAHFSNDNGVRRTVTPPVSSSRHLLQVIQSQARPTRPPSKEITVKDFMHGMIEHSIKRKGPILSPNPRPGSGLAPPEIPTITSILKDNQLYINQRNEARSTMVAEQRRMVSPHFPHGQEWNQVQPVHHHETYAREPVPMYIPPREEKRVVETRKPFPAQLPGREAMHRIQVGELPKDDEQNETLDLSVKRDRDSSPARPFENRVPAAQKSVSVPLRPSAGFVRQPAPYTREAHETVYEKPHPYSGGSITQGTPVNVDKSRKVVTTSVKEVGVPAIFYDPRTGQQMYLTERERFLVTPQSREQQRPSPVRHVVADPKGSVRENMLYNDYILSQQMIRKEREPARHGSPLGAEHANYMSSASQQPFMQSEARKHYFPGFPPDHYPQSAPGGLPASKQVHHRQGVIQHTPVGSVRYAQPQVKQPGVSQPMQLDFSSFADVIASQPSLPIPEKDKERPSPIPMPAHRGKPSNGEMEKERMWVHHGREPPRTHDDKDHHSMTAETLIDSIVTHQMVTGDSHSVNKIDHGRPDLMFQRYSKESKAPEVYRPNIHEVVPKPITLGEHIDSIITKDFARPGYEGEPPFGAFVPGGWRGGPRGDPRHAIPQHHGEKDHRPDMKQGQMQGHRMPAPMPRFSPSEGPGGSRNQHPQMTDRHQMQERHPQMQDRHIQMAERHAHQQMQERHQQMQGQPMERQQMQGQPMERHPQAQDRHVQMQERLAQMPERHGQVLERQPHMVERHPRMPERQHVMVRHQQPQNFHLNRDRLIHEQLKESWQVEKRHSSPQVFDYVKNKIAEVMRTSDDTQNDQSDKSDSRPGPAPSPSKRPRLEEDKARQSPFQRVDPNYGPKGRPSPNPQNSSSPYQAMQGYGYGYGVMNVRNPNPSRSPSSANPAHHSQSPSPAPAPPVSAHATMPSSATPTAPSPHSRQVHSNPPSGNQKEPAPLLSAQYEPLSDED